MKKILFALIAMFAISTLASAAPYKLDDAAIDNAFESAIVVSPLDLMNEVPAAVSVAPTVPAARPPSAATAVVPFVDFIVEIVAAVEDNSVARYCGNTSFFMWG